jgi:hypothetical protein
MFRTSPFVSNSWRLRRTKSVLEALALSALSALSAFTALSAFS